jgi:type II secretory pathway pseudopilin PulG
MKTFLLSRLQTRSAHSRGISLVEPLVLAVMLAIVMSGTAIVFNSVNNRVVSTQQQVDMQTSIDDNLSQIKTVARNFTCCSGICTTTPPTTFGVVNGVTQPCATNNPLDDRYYFPQVDLASTTANFPNTTTPSEPMAVEQLCQSTNTIFLTPFKNAVDLLPQPVNATRATAMNSSGFDKILVVSYTDSINNRVTRVVNVTPQMAFYCT